MISTVSDKALLMSLLFSGYVDLWSVHSGEKHVGSLKTVR